MTEDQATALRAQLLARQARLLDYAVQQADADPNSWGWLRMLADVQAALKAIEENSDFVTSCDEVKTCLSHATHTAISITEPD